MLSNISKIIEKLIHVYLTMFLNANNIFYKKQFGFRHNHSTTHVLFEIAEKIPEGFRSNYLWVLSWSTESIFNNKSWYSSKKLNHYGITGIANKWFQLFLEDWKLFTSVQGCHFAKQSVRYGVPQGLVLGLLLFILFINDLYIAVEFSLFTILLMILTS